MTLMQLFSFLEKQTKDPRIAHLYIDYMENRIDKKSMQLKLRYLATHKSLRKAVCTYAAAQSIVTSLSPKTKCVVHAKKLRGNFIYRF